MKYYFDWICPPSRAIYLLLKVNNVPFEGFVVSLKRSEHLEESFKSVNRFQRLPCINVDGYQLAESVAIYKYLCKTFLPVIENYNPQLPKEKALVDEYLEWQANNIRLGGAMYFKTQWMFPKLLKSEANIEEVSTFKYVMENSLDTIEDVWLADPNKTFLVSDKISFADIMACVDLEQIRITGYNPFENRPKLEKMWKNVKALTNPFYDEAHEVCYKMGLNKPKL
ncbi:CLUMA_CG021348, isoform A [Clunio marinus]|uniref:CLUMA_CG021348, isoform A n=1 Tax=Clunio marinus TaxID=568069 RepID=A0A1J1J9L9_9DIPT|nr:CLUMA_CG021348, isoform A [Clunio marinus]